MICFYYCLAEEILTTFELKVRKQRKRSTGCMAVAIGNKRP
jgi:hypothetical protein